MPKSLPHTWSRPVEYDAEDICDRIDFRDETRGLCLVDEQPGILFTGLASQHWPNPGGSTLRRMKRDG